MPINKTDNDGSSVTLSSAQIAGGEGGISLLLLIVVPGSITALLVLSPLNMGWAWKNYPISIPTPPPSTILLI